MKFRESNFELMRVISMIFIVLWHILMHGNYINNCNDESLKIFYTIIQFLIIIHVNSFVLLSGYFQSKKRFKLSKLLNLIIQVIFYSELILILGEKLNIIDNSSIVAHINNFLPSITSNYWFINNYIIVYIFSNYLNKFINKINQKEFKWFLILMFIILSVLPYLSGQKFIYNNGYNFYNFIFLYFIGAYLRLYPLKDHLCFKNISLNSYRLLMIFLFLTSAMGNFVVNNFGFSIISSGTILNEIGTRITSNYLSYSSPFVILQTIAYFELFSTKKVKCNRIINYISACTFGVYLIHDNNIMRGYIYKFLNIDTGVGTIYGYTSLLNLILFTLEIFLGCIIIESIRKLIEKVLAKLPLIKKTISKIRNYIESFNLKIEW